MPADSGLIFAVVQHLERHHPGVLADLLGKHTQMPVQQAEDGARPLVNHVYIIPPNSVLTLEKGLLRVTRPAEEGVRTPIDAFLRSLAREQGERAIGIILSGAGSDGTAGLRAVKDQGGFTLAQSPETAKYDSMPQNAIAAGLVDMALPVEEMPARILAYAGRVAAVQRLENEVRTIRADLQSAMQDLEAANEELKSANEELISTNEELQSANEELQTSKEELQSANDELHSKVLELDASNADLQHHYTGTQIATIFLDRELRILRCTPAAGKLFNVRESDIGRPIRDLAPRFVED
jgi:PAS domain-containing protein